MITLSINNSLSSIQGLKNPFFNVLRKKLSYTEATPFRTGRFQSHRYHLMDRKGVFPTGLLYIVQDFIKEHNIQVTIIDKRIQPKSRLAGSPSLFLPNRAPEPREAQLNAVKAFLDPINEGRGIINAVTASGKSLIAALICDALQVPTLLVVPSLELKKQLTATFKYYFGDDKAGPLDKHGQKQFLFTIENVDALDAKIVIKGLSMILVDETHHSAAKQYVALNTKSWNDVYYRVGMSGTPWRTLSHEKLLFESFLSKVIYKISYRDAVATNSITPLEAFYFDVPRMKVRGKRWAEVYSEVIVNNKVRNDKICELIKSLHTASISTLILVNQIEHGKMLVNQLALDGLEIPFANGQDESSRIKILEFSIKEINTLIASSIVGEGVDTRACEAVILAGGTGKSSIKIMQNCGRTLRLYEGKETGKVFVFKEVSHVWFRSHHKFFEKIMSDEYGIGLGRLE